MIYTTNALESVHAQLRKIIKTRGHFPNDEAATKLIWLALRNITATWERRPCELLALRAAESIRDPRTRIASSARVHPTAKMPPAHGRCRPCGRTERAHRDLENRTERGFPQRPHASSV